MIWYVKTASGRVVGWVTAPNKYKALGLARKRYPVVMLYVEGQRR
jgi:hypothetical protein